MLNRPVRSAGKRGYQVCLYPWTYRSMTLMPSTYNPLQLDDPSRSTPYLGDIVVACLPSSEPTHRRLAPAFPDSFAEQQHLLSTIVTFAVQPESIRVARVHQLSAGTHYFRPATSASDSAVSASRRIRARYPLVPGPSIPRRSDPSARRQSDSWPRSRSRPKRTYELAIANALTDQRGSHIAFACEWR